MIINVSQIATIHLAIEPIDMRKFINGLSLIVQTCFDLDATSNALYIFTNKPKNKLKIIYWDRDGFWLFMKRLNKVRLSGLKMMITILESLMKDNSLGCLMV